MKGRKSISNNKKASSFLNNPLNNAKVKIDILEMLNTIMEDIKDVLPRFSSFALSLSTKDVKLKLESGIKTAEIVNKY